MKEAAIAGVIPAIISAVAVYFSSRAEKNSRPVSNGFASHVLASLDEIKAELKDHIRNHDTPNGTRDN